MTQEVTLTPRSSTAESRPAMRSAPALGDDARLASADIVRELAQRTLERATAHLFSLQNDDGHWRAELEGDSILQSEYILMKWMLGAEDDPRIPQIAAYLRRQQQPDGGWIQFPGGKMDISATVKGYFCLKLLGDDPDAPHMRRARDLILAAGGAERINSFTKFYLAALGQVSYDALPSIPPEIVFFPKSAYIHLDKVSAWSRTMILPLSIVTTFRPTRTLPPHLGIPELFKDPRNQRRLVVTQDRPHPFWSRFFLAADRFVLKTVDRLGVTPWRAAALKWIEAWLLGHLERSEGLGAIYPPMVYIQVALRCLGYPDDHPVLVQARRHLDDLMIRDEETGEIRIQPCVSPMWDTGIAAHALCEAGFDQRTDAMRRCSRWLVDKECREPGDWTANVPGVVEPSGWFFEYANGFYPDTDDTAMVSMALRRIGTPEGIEAGKRGVRWVLAMQNEDGGWAAFDRTEDRPILEHVPFADHNAIQDPSCPDITGRILECLGYYGFTASHPVVQRAVRYIAERQEPDGAFFGRWGVNYVYGTFQVLVGLRSVGCNMDEPWIRKAGQWFKDHQQEDGSFGESANSYEDPALRGEGPPTASQTAWGAMGLMAVFGDRDPAARRAINWLAETQLESGNWDEPWFTGTGFPRVFYLRYHLYKLYFPVMAIGRYLRGQDALPNLQPDTSLNRGE